MREIYSNILIITKKINRLTFDMKRKDPWDKKTKINLKYLKDSLDLKKFIKLISSKSLRIKWNNKDKYYFTESNNSWKNLKYKILKACADYNTTSEYLNYRIDKSYPGNKAWNVSFETKLEKGLLLPNLSKNFKLDFIKKFSVTGGYKEFIIRKCDGDPEDNNIQFYCDHLLFSSKIDKSYYLVIFTNIYLELSDGNHMKKGWNIMDFTSICDIHQKFNNKEKAIKYIKKKEKELSNILELG